MKKILFVLLCGFTCINITYANTRPFNASDLTSLKRISNPQISPDGTLVVFELKQTDLEDHSSNRDIWRVDINANNAAKALTQHSASDSNPVWSSDGKTIYFLSTRSGSSQVWRMQANGSHKKQITDFPIGIYDLTLSPDNQYLAFSAEVYPNCPTLKCTAQKIQDAASAQPSGLLFNQLFTRHWDSWETGKQTHLFILKINAKGVAKGKPIRVSARLNANTPPKPFGGKSDFTFSADSQYLFLTARLVSKDQAWTTNLDIYKVPIDDREAILNITASNLAMDTQPIVSSDGKWLAYLAMQRPGYESDRNLITLIDLENGKTSILSDNWDRSASVIKFSSDNRSIIATTDSLGQKPIYRIDIKNGERKQLSDQGNVSSFDVHGDTVVYTLSNFKTPPTLHRIELSGDHEKQLTHLNDQQLSKIDMGDYQQFTFEGWNQENVYGYIIKPAHFDPEKTYPSVLFIHGGPQGNFGNTFHSRWNPQVFAGAGYAVIIIDFHGSTGYGQAFTDSISKDWGGKPLLDLQKGLQAALDKSPWLNHDNICAMGGSYGGFMVNWIAGLWPERFKCLVNHDGVFDHRMMYYSTEELWFSEWEHGGPYYKNPSSHEKHNPVNHVSKWQTPMLLIHGALDFRVPETQSFAAFTALQRRGIKSRLLYYPDENHWVLKPQNVIQWHDEVLKWLDEHLK